MSSRFTISGVGPLRRIFEDRRRRAQDSSVAVGYTANYAVYVHEMVGANFKRPGSQAKFLEVPARQLDVGKYVNQAFKQGKSLADGLMVAGLKLQRDSQKIVPVDLGNLHNSAFTRKER